MAEHKLCMYYDDMWVGGENFRVNKHEQPEANYWISNSKERSSTLGDLQLYFG